MFAIIKKEIRTYFYSITGFLFAAVNLCVIGLYFLAANLLGMNPSLAPVMQSVIFILLIMVPILTMRIFSEEKRQKTDQLLLTAPIPVWKIVVGKYLAAMAVFCIPVLVSCLFPFLLLPFGQVAFAESYTAILGYFLYGGAAISVGLFLSAITESQIIAAVLSFIALFLTFLMSGIVGIINQGGGNIGNIFTIFDFASRLENLMTGIIDWKAILYYISVIALMLFFTYEAIQKRRYQVSRHTLSLSVYSNVTAVIAFAIAVFVNLILGELPSRYTELDVTREGLYTLTDESVRFLDSLTEDVDIYVVGTQEMLETYNFKEMTYTLNQYSERSPHVHVNYKDPTLDPTFIRQLTEDQVTVGSLIVAKGDRTRTISPYDIYQSEIDYQTYSEVRTGYDGEGQITSAISFVTNGDLPKIYCITGHREKQLADYQYFSQMLKKMNVETADLNLMSAGEIPEDASVIMVLGPQSDYSESDTKLLQNYLEKGGKAIIALNYTEEDTPNLDGLIAHYGIQRVNGIVMDMEQNHYYQTPLYLLPDVESSVLTNGILADRLPALLPEASGFLISDNSIPDSVDLEEALRTTDQSYAKMEINESTLSEMQEGDVQGPFILAAYVTEEVEGGQTKLALFSCDTLFEDSVNQAVAGGNVQMASDALNDMVEVKVTSAIPAKSYDLSYLVVPQGTAYFMGMLFVIVLPIFLLIAGIVIWARRRRK
ncbi:MAG: Gldg family protein [Lachnospiraceae bacterium]|nr:Gldg family protein [Lachnospiraceae bacterium]